MAALGNPLVSFSQGSLLRQGDPSICCRLAYKWLASQVAPGRVKSEPSNLAESTSTRHSMSITSHRPSEPATIAWPGESDDVSENDEDRNPIRSRRSEHPDYHRDLQLSVPRIL